MNYETYIHKNVRHRRKERILYVMGGKCVCCGYDKANTALELHHINSEEKEFTISNGNNISWERTREELKKTILVCANCHREIHEGIIDVSNFKSSFDADKADQISEIIKGLKGNKYYYCKYCGAEVTRG